jgi:hypothetical protein
LEFYLIVASTHKLKLKAAIVNPAPQREGVFFNVVIVLFEFGLI